MAWSWPRRIALLVVWVTGFPSGQASEPAYVERPGLTVYVFTSEACPVCEAQKPFFDALGRQHPHLEILELEVVATQEHWPVLRAMAAAHGVRPGSVPMVFAGGRVWTGDSGRVRAEIAGHVAACLAADCPDSRRLIAGEERRNAITPPSGPDTVIDLPLLGQVNLALQPLLLSTSLIAFVDGFNPCSIWVLTMLLVLVLHSGSRGRVLLVGLTFLCTTALIYGLFIVGVFGLLAFTAYLSWITWAVALVALAMGSINVKDYFWFRRGFSLTIDDRHKPGIFRGFRNLMMHSRMPLPLMGATVVLASGIALIELPCTAGFPVIWSALVQAHEVSWAEFLLLLGVYLLIYLGIELVIFAVAVVKLRIDRFEESRGRVLKLIGGVIMIALAGVLIAAPEMMSRAGPALGVFLAAFAVTALIVVVHRYLLPRVGIRIGDSW
jgi:hypothetical protein